MRVWQRTVIGLTVALTAIGIAQAREQIRVVGSSTVYPFSSYVAEEFGATTDFTTPIVESTGSGGGLKLFCNGVGSDTPDVTNASRPIKKSEFQRCQDNGVGDIIEVMFGYDGIVIAQNEKNEPLSLTREQLTLAVAAQVPQDGELVENPYVRWSQIDASLPDKEILIYGPPTSSGTRDAFEELVMEAVSEDLGYGGEYSNIRQDGAFVPSGENDNLIVQKLGQNRHAVGIFGYSFLEENKSLLSAASVGGVEPNPSTISSGEYPVSRSLFFYVKKAHLGEVSGLAEYVDLFLAEKMVGNYGYLKDLGLIPLPKERREAVRAKWADREGMTKDDLVH
ncbi:PstS family phosphate ABC transporter substrate-binding protein [Ectothiorhodospiraceae bacterium WFHF3C12]|nr:PstS family phosphate ABC transporter substrate-binding protein [Ectothiorhodospiraceae bacterium WFHF3C12]